MSRDCPRCRQRLKVSPEGRAERLFCPDCGNSYSHADIERIRVLTDKLGPIGGYRVVNYLGSGEFADVWEADHEDTTQTVAIKLPYRVSASPASLLLRELRATHALDHPHVVKLHKVVRDGQHTFGVCDLVRGVSLDAWLRDHDPTPLESARMCLSLAQAVHHAHQRGIIHRDLKPSNILIDSEGLPYITDFGLAKIESDEIVTSLERYRQAAHLLAGGASKAVKRDIVGTPAYMSPEQARGDGDRVDHRADVYALGTILYELLAGRRPFQESGLERLLEAVATKQPTRPRRFRPCIPRDLETICLTAMSKLPGSRYGSAQAMAQDCLRLLQGQPIEARPFSRQRRICEWLSQHQLEAASLLIATTITVTMAVLLVSQ